MTQKNNYHTYSEDDFLADPYFQDWVLKPNAENERFWTSWLMQNPSKQEAIEQARKLLTMLAFSVHEPAEARVRESLSQAMEIIDQHEEELSTPARKIVLLKRWMAVAALFVLVAGAGTVYYWYHQRPAVQLISTAFGAIKKVTLPDSTYIVLNGNSTLTFNRRWTHGQPREVWVDGEAYFNVRHIDTDSHITPGERFLVHLKDVTVEVLGTSFNIRQRRGNTEIMLQQGKIQLVFNDSQRSPIIMQPGDLVYVGDRAEQLKIDSTASADDYVKWTEKKLILNNASLDEVIHYIEDNYGRKIVLGDSSLSSRKIEGTLLLDNLNDILFVLSKILNVDVQQQDTTIYFRPK